MKNRIVLALLTTVFAHAASAQLVDNKDGTITDDQTGLMWIQNADQVGAYPWTAANTQANDLTFAGHSDWRLPDISELESLYATLSATGTFVPAPFLNLEIDGATDWYWAANQGEPVCWYGGVCADQYGHFRFDTGESGYSEASYLLNVLAVRDAPTGLACEFRDNGDGTVTDTRTALMWPQDAFNAAFGPATRWKDAAAHVAGITVAGYADWRLPTVDEAQALYDLFTASGSYDPTPFYFPITGGSDWRWTSQENTFFDFETGAPRTTIYGAYHFVVRDTDGMTCAP